METIAESEELVPDSERELRNRPNLVHNQNVEGFSFAIVKQIVQQFLDYRAALYQSTTAQLEFIHFLRKLAQNPMAVPTDVRLNECKFNERTLKCNIAYGNDELTFFTPQRAYLAFKIVSMALEHIRIGTTSNIRFNLYQFTNLALPGTNAIAHFDHEGIEYLMNSIWKATNFLHILHFTTSKPVRIYGDLHITNPRDGTQIFDQMNNDGGGYLSMVYEPNLIVKSVAEVMIAVDSDAGAIRLSSPGGTIRILFVSFNGNSTDNALVTLEYLRFKLKIPTYCATDLDYEGLHQAARLTTLNPRLALWSHILKTKYKRIYVKQSQINEPFCTNARIPTDDDYSKIRSILDHKTAKKIPEVVEEVVEFARRRRTNDNPKLCGTSQLINGREVIEREINALRGVYEHPEMFDFDLFLSRKPILHK